MAEFLGSLTGVLTVIGFIIGFVYLYKKVQATNVEATIAAKDDAIHTQAQVNDANDRRIKQLEDSMERMEKENLLAIAKLEAENAELRGKIEVLEQYQAPEAIREFQAQQTVIIQILKSIQMEIAKLG